jgi:hypothetical protein
VIALDPNDGYIASAVIDTSGATHYAYFGGYNSVDYDGKIFKIRLSDFTYFDTLTIPESMFLNAGAVIDSGAGYAYFGGCNSDYNGMIFKIRLSDFTNEDTLTIPEAPGGFGSAVIDTSDATHYAYFGGCDPDYKTAIYKIRLSDFSNVSVLSIPESNDMPYSAVIDTGAGFAYFGGYDSAYYPVIHKIQLSDFTLAGALSLTEISDQPSSATIDTELGYAYFGSYSSNGYGMIAGIRLADFTKAFIISVPQVNGTFGAAVIDTSGATHYVYLGSSTSPGIILKMSFGENTALIESGQTLLVNGDLTIASGIFDADGNDMYVAGDWYNYAGQDAFIPNGNTVTFDGGNQTLYGSTTFYNLSRLYASTLSFEAGTTQTIEGTLTLTGAPGDLLHLRSTGSGRWKIDPQGARIIDYVDVQDSDNTNPLVIFTYDNYHNSIGYLSTDNNINWFEGNPTPPKPPEPPEPPPEPWQPPKPPEPPQPTFTGEDISIGSGTDLVSSGGETVSTGGQETMEAAGEESTHAYEEGDKLKKLYPRGRYRTAVIVFEGVVLVTPYDEMGVKTEGTVTLTAGETTAQTGEVK